MTIHLPKSHYTLTTFVTPKDSPAKALGLGLIKAAQTAIEIAIQITGKAPWVYEMETNEGVEFYCQNAIPTDKEVLETKKSENKNEKKENHQKSQKPRPK